MEIIRRHFMINPTQRRSRSRRRAGNKMLRKTGLLNYLLCRLFLTPASATPDQRYLGQLLK
jgi:hypothetical protein